MTDQAILKIIQSLLDSIKGEIMNFIEFLTQKYKSARKEKVIPRYGSLKGTFKMVDDFDEPLEDFQDYLE